MKGLDKYVLQEMGSLRLGSLKEVPKRSRTHPMSMRVGGNELNSCLR